MKLPTWLRVVLWILLIFLVYSIFRSPEGAADLVVGGVEGIGRGLAAIFVFFDSVLSRLGDDAAAGLGPLAVT